MRIVTPQRGNALIFFFVFCIELWGAKAVPAPQEGATEAQINTTSKDPALEAKDVPEKTETKDASSDELQTAATTYSDKGLTFSSGERFEASMLNHLQLRAVTPFDQDPKTATDLKSNTPSFLLRRARLKLDGHLYKPWLKFKFQYDWMEPMLTDFSVDVARFKAATVRIGRGKVLFNDETLASSAKQQFVDRSLLHSAFTLDRQQGVQLLGRLFEKSFADLNYSVGVFTGRGIGIPMNDDTNLLYAARIQWNAIGEPIPFNQSDYKISNAWQLNFAFAAATNKSQCTAFKSANDSCRALPLYPSLSGSATVPPLSAGQFRVDQGVFEVRSLYRGIYFKSEGHFKRVEDTTQLGTPWPQLTEMAGVLVQMGYFPHAVFDWMPRGLELAARFALLDTDTSKPSDGQREYTAAINYFFDGHRNKLTVDATHHVLESAATGRTSGERYRLQWNLLF